jgi:hypothetical protein
LAEIARIAGTASQGTEYSGSYDEEASGSADDSVSGCRIKALPARLHEKAAQVAAQINSVNAPLAEPLPGGVLVDSSLRLTLTTAKYWGSSPFQLSVSFMENTPADLRARIVSHLNAWTATTGVSFAETSGTSRPPTLTSHNHRT